MRCVRLAPARAARRRAQRRPRPGVRASALAEDDAYDVRRARNASGLLRAFNDIGVLAAADVHVAVRLAAIAGESDETIELATALAVRAPRLGHVFVDLATIRETATVESDEASTHGSSLA